MLTMPDCRISGLRNTNNSSGLTSQAKGNNFKVLKNILSMKKNFLLSQTISGLFKKAGKGFFVLALTLTIALNSLAHTAQPFVFGCVTPGQNMTIDAVITNAGASTYYQWQFRDNSGNWRCFVNGTNTINGVNFTVSGATLAATANNAPLLTINSVTTALENVFVRVLMRDNAYPVCNTSSSSGHNNTGDVYGGDDQALNETKYLRLHVFASMTICPPNAYACTGNLLVTTGGAYYGGFENISFNSGTNSYTRSNFGAGLASSDFSFGTGNGTYQDINNPYAKNTSFTRNIAPHTGNYQMVVEGSTTLTNRVWYKSAAVQNGNQYRFDVWAVRVNSTDPIIELRAGSTLLATFDMSTVAVGTWKLIHGTYTATSTGSIEFSIRDGRSGGNNDFSLDDICLSVCTNCAALPLHQLDLRAYLQGNNVNLKWVAENEMGTESFVVERSTDGLNYSSIASKAPSGPVNTPTEYQHGDDIQGLGSSIIYYRIKATDREGRYAYSNIATVRLNKTAGVQVWPNPFGDYVNITYNSSANTKVDVSVVNSLGKIVKQSSYTVSRGLNQISVNGLETMSSGIYFIRITDKNTNEVYIQKISK